MPAYPVPTLEDLEKYGLYARAFDIVDKRDVDAGRSSGATKLAHLRGAAGRIASYVLKRAGGPILEWDDAFIQASVHVACRTLMALPRGYDPKLGNDEEIKRLADEAMQWAKDVAVGDAEAPFIVDSTSGLEEASPLGESESLSDLTTRGSCSRRCGC